MDSDGIGWGWIALTALFFGVGFALSWIRMRRKIAARYQQALEEEIKRRVQQEVLRRITQGPEPGRSGDDDAADEEPPRKR